MFPIKVKKSLAEGDDRAKNTRVLIRNGIIAVIILAIFVTPYIVNFEFYVEEDTPGGNLDQFLDVTKASGETVTGSEMLTSNAGTADPSQSTASSDGAAAGGTLDSNALPSTDGSTTRADGTISSPGESGVAGNAGAGEATASAEGDSDSGDAGATEQSAAEAGEDRLQKKEKMNAEKKKDVVTTKILGTKIDQRLGQQSPGKQCVVFYAEDPEVVKDVVSTKVCMFALEFTQ